MTDKSSTPASMRFTGLATEEPHQVLLVDDDPIVAADIREQLSDFEGWRFSVGHCQTLSECLASIEREMPLVIMLDLSLPDVQGLAGLEQLTALHPELPVVVMTSNDDKNVALRAMASGAQDYIVKGTVDREYLVRSLSYAIQRKQVEGLQGRLSLAASAQRRANHANRVLRAVRSVNQLMTRAKNRDELLTVACTILVETRDYRRTWIGLLDDGQSLITFGKSGFTSSRTGRNLTAPVKDIACVSRALRDATVVDTGLSCESCEECIIKAVFGVERGMLTRIAHAGAIYGVLVVDSAEDVHMDQEERELFQEVATDIARALHHIDAQEARDQAEKELKSTLSELQGTTAQLVHSARLAALGELTAGVAHELNQPLNAMKIISQALLKYPPEDPDELTAEHEALVALVDRMAETIDHMRIFSRRGEVGPKRATDINELARGALKLVGQLIRDMGVELVPSYTEPLPQIEADAVLIEQVVVNLLSNARDSLEDIPRQGRRIILRTSLIKQQEHFHPWVCVEVEDNGPGIPEDIRSRLFEPFFTTKANGTGLGLSLTRKILQEHGGTVDVTSTPYESTIFRLLIPAMR